MLMRQSDRVTYGRTYGLTYTYTYAYGLRCQYRYTKPFPVQLAARNHSSTSAFGTQPRAQVYTHSLSHSLASIRGPVYQYVLFCSVLSCPLLSCPLLFSFLLFSSAPLLSSLPDSYMKC